MRCYFVLFHETTVVNLLECLCYHAHAVGNVRDAALDLTDYCARRLAALHSKAKLFRAAKPAKDAAQSPGDFARSLEKRSAKEELDQQSLEIEFSASVSCVALVRMVVEHLGELTVAGMSRLLETHDFLLSIVPLLEHPPWTRARYERVDADDDSDEPKKKRVWQKLQEGDWKDVPTDRLPTFPASQRRAYPLDDPASAKRLGIAAAPPLHCTEDAGEGRPTPWDLRVRRRPPAAAGGQRHGPRRPGMGLTGALEPA